MLAFASILFKDLQAIASLFFRITHTLQPIQAINQPKFLWNINRNSCGAGDFWQRIA